MQGQLGSPILVGRAIKQLLIAQHHYLYVLILALGDFVLILINLRLGLNPWFHLLSFTDNFVRLWLLKDHIWYPAFGQEHREVCGLQPKVLWRSKGLSVTPNSLYPCLPLRVVPKKSKSHSRILKSHVLMAFMQACSYF